jgi:hypothetical protein
MTTIEVTIPDEPIITIEVFEGGLGATIDYESLPANDLSSQGPTSSSKNAGTTVGTMDCVYLSGAGTWLLADASSESTAKGLLCIALQSKTSGQALKVALSGSFVRNDAWAWANEGDMLYLSAASGMITDTQPTGTDTVVRVVGWIISPTVIYFDPSADYITLN